MAGEALAEMEVVALVLASAEVLVTAADWVAALAVTRVAGGLVTVTAVGGTVVELVTVMAVGSVASKPADHRL